MNRLDSNDFHNEYYQIPSDNKIHESEQLEPSLERELGSVEEKPQRDSGEIPSPIKAPVLMPPKKRSPEEISLRKQENASLDQEERLASTLKRMGKGRKTSSKLRSPITKETPEKLANQGVKTTKKVSKHVPFGFGFLVESYEERKEASKCRKEAKAIQKEIRNTGISNESKKIIQKEIGARQDQQKAILVQIASMDKEMARACQGGQLIDRNRLGTQIKEREGLLAQIHSLDESIKVLRRGLYKAELPVEELDSKIEEMDQKVAEQKQHERKGYGHGTRGATVGSYHVLTVAKFGSMAADVGTAASVLTPVTAGIGLVAAGAGGALHIRNIVNAAEAMQDLNTMKLEAGACLARAMYERTIMEDPTLSAEVRALAQAKVGLEMEKAQLITDFVHIQREFAIRKIVANSIGLAENTALAGASTCSLLTMIPEPTTSATMYGLALGLTGAKLALMLSEWGFEVGAEVLEERHEKKMHKRRDFGELADHAKGITRSQLGVDIRLACMLQYGIAPSSVVDYHKIFDVKGFIEHVGEVAVELGEKQEYKKGLAIISDYYQHIQDTYSEMVSQLGKKEKAA